MLTITDSNSANGSVFRVDGWDVCFSDSATRYLRKALNKSKGAVFVHDSEPPKSSELYAVFKRVPILRDYYTSYSTPEGVDRSYIALCTNAVQRYFNKLPDYLYVCI